MLLLLSMKSAVSCGGWCFPEGRGLRWGRDPEGCGQFLGPERRLGKPLLLPVSVNSSSKCVRFVHACVAGRRARRAAEPAFLPLSLIERGPCVEELHKDTGTKKAAQQSQVLGGENLGSPGLCGTSRPQMGTIPRAVLAGFLRLLGCPARS